MDDCACGLPLIVEAAASDAVRLEIDRWGVVSTRTYLDPRKARIAAYTVILADLGAHCVLTPNPGWLVSCPLGHKRLMSDEEMGASSPRTAWQKLEAQLLARARRSL